MNLASNPWSFVPADVTPQAISAVGVPGLQIGANGIIFITLTGAPSFPLTVGKEYLIAGAGVAGYNGLVQAVTVGASSLTAIPSTKHPALASAGGALANSGGGTLQPGPQWTAQVRIEDLSWLKPAALNDVILVQDQNGNDVWNDICSGVGQQKRGKIFWVNGFWLKTLQSGELAVTIN